MAAVERPVFFVLCGLAKGPVQSYFDLCGGLPSTLFGLPDDDKGQSPSGSSNSSAYAFHIILASTGLRPLFIAGGDKSMARSIILHPHKDTGDWSGVPIQARRGRNWI